MTDWDPISQSLVVNPGPLQDIVDHWQETDPALSPQYNETTRTADGTEIAIQFTDFASSKVLDFLLSY